MEKLRDQSEALRTLAKEDPGKLVKIIFVTFNFVLIVGTTIVIYQFWQHDQFRENAGSASLSLRTLRFTIDSDMFINNKRANGLRIQMGKGTPNTSPMNCWQVRRGQEHICLSWHNFGRLLIEYTEYEKNSECYHFSWELESSDSKVNDCIDKKVSKQSAIFASNLPTVPTESWFFSQNYFDATPLLSGQMLTANQKLSLSASLNDEVILLSQSGAFVLAGSTAQPLGIESSETELCFTNGVSYESIYSDESRKILEYSLCTSTDSNKALQLMEKHTRTKASSENQSEILSAFRIITSTVFWSFNPMLSRAEHSLTQLKHFLERAGDRDLTFDFKKVIVLKGHFPDDFDSVSGDIADEMKQLLNEFNMSLYMEVSPFFSIHNDHFLTGVINGYWLKEYKENAPALSMLENVHTVLDPTNEEALEWFQGLVTNYSEHLTTSGLIFNANKISDLPMYFKSQMTLHHPYEFTKIFMEAMKTHFESTDLNENLFLVSSVPQGLQDSACLQMDSLSFTWEGLRSVIPRINSMAVMGHKCFIPPSIGHLSDIGTAEFVDQLFLRWVQIYVYMPSISIDMDVFDLISNETQEALENLLRFRKEHIEPILLFFNSQTGYNELVVKPLWASFPSDRNVFQVDDQFALGDSVIVAPILSPNTSERSVYLPEGGNWELYLRGEGTHRIYEGGALHTLQLADSLDVLQFQTCKFCPITSTQLTLFQS